MRITDFADEIGNIFDSVMADIGAQRLLIQPVVGAQPHRLEMVIAGRHALADHLRASLLEWPTPVQYYREVTIQGDNASIKFYFV